MLFWLLVTTTLDAFCAVTVSVELCPDVIVVGFAEIATDAEVVEVVTVMDSVVEK